MRVAVVGSRDITDKKLVYDIINERLGSCPEPWTLISGGAKGVDSLVMEYSKEFPCDFILFKPYHLIDKSVDYSPRFFFTRNKQIVDNCDQLVAIWDGESKGTKHAIDYASKRGKEVFVYKVEEDD